MHRLLFAGFACLISNSAFAQCNPTDHAENVKWCVQQHGNGICRCVRLNIPNVPRMPLINVRRVSLMKKNQD